MLLVYNGIGFSSDKLEGARAGTSRFDRMNFIKHNLECSEFHFSGQCYTWREKRSGKDDILEMLDRCFVIIEWLQKFPNARVKHHIFNSSYHCFMLSYLPSSYHLFKFEKSGV